MSNRIYLVTGAAVDKGRIGEAYILAYEPVTLKEMCEMLQEECDCQKIKFYLPLGLADKIAKKLEKKAERKAQKNSTKKIKKIS